MANFKIIVPTDETEILEMRDLLNDAGIRWHSGDAINQWWPSSSNPYCLIIENDFATTGSRLTYKACQAVPLTVDDLRAFYGHASQFDETVFTSMLGGE